VAACGTRAAAGNTGDWVSEQRASYIDAFLIGLNETRFVEGRNLPSSIVVHEARPSG
jgi:hypothetical protein